MSGTDGCRDQFLSLMAVEVCIYAKDGCRGLYMVIIVEFSICHWRLWRSVYGIYGCVGLYMAFMVVEFNVRH